jgi:hypothetical protein
MFVLFEKLYSRATRTLSMQQFHVIDKHCQVTNSSRCTFLLGLTTIHAVSNASRWHMNFVMMAFSDGHVYSRLSWKNMSPVFAERQPVVESYLASSTATYCHALLSSLFIYNPFETFMGMNSSSFCSGHLARFLSSGTVALDMLEFGPGADSPFCGREFRRQAILTMLL